jgi:hypothetical protein
MKLRRVFIFPLVFCLLLACNRAFNFSQELRTIVALSGPLVESLPISGNKQLLLNDFTAIANSAATFKEGLDACGQATNAAACRVSEVETLTTSVNTVLNQGRFGQHERLQQIQQVIQGVINAARIYYGAPQVNAMARTAPMSKKEAEQAMKDGMRELRQLMEPVR